MSNFKFLLKKFVKALVEIARGCHKYFINRTKSPNFSIIYWILLLLLLLIFFFFLKLVFFDDIFCNDQPDNCRLHMSAFHFKVRDMYFTFVLIDLYQQNDLKDILDISDTRFCFKIISKPHKMLFVFPLKSGVRVGDEFFVDLPKRFWWSNEVTKIKIVETEHELTFVVVEEKPRLWNRIFIKSVAGRRTNVR